MLKLSLIASLSLTIGACSEKRTRYVDTAFILATLQGGSVWCQNRIGDSCNSVMRVASVGRSEAVLDTYVKVEGGLKVKLRHTAQVKDGALCTTLDESMLRTAMIYRAGDDLAQIGPAEVLVPDDMRARAIGLMIDDSRALLGKETCSRFTKKVKDVGDKGDELAEDEFREGVLQPRTHVSVYSFYAQASDGISLRTFESARGPQ